MNITAQNIITKAFLISGIKAINEVLSGIEAFDALRSLNMIMGVFQLEQLLQFDDIVVNATLVPGLNPHTIGGPAVGATFLANRPNSILSAYIRDLSNNDSSLIEIDATQYDEISVKNLTSDIPTYFFYNPKYPNGEIFLSPVPNAAYTINLRYKNPLGMFGTLLTSHNYPDGYEQLLVYQLAFHLSSEYGSPRPDLKEMVDSIKNTIKKNNWQNFELPLDSRTPFGDNNIYDIGW
jgi:hypothetical protein